MIVLVIVLTSTASQQECKSGVAGSMKGRASLTDDSRYSDPDLVRALETDGEEALAELWESHSNRLARMVQVRMDPRLHGRLEVDDILQEAFLDARQRLHHYLKDSSQSFYIWLRLVVAQTLVDVHRRHLGARMRDIRREAKSPAASTASLAFSLVAHMTSPSHAAMRSELAVQLKDALDSMDEMDREILVLRHFEELTNNEVSELLGLKKSTTSNRYVRALARLKGLLSGYLADEE